MNKEKSAPVFLRLIRILYDQYIPDIFALIGLLMLGFGLYQFNPALMFVVIGSILFFISVFGRARNQA